MLGGLSKLIAGTFVAKAFGFGRELAYAAWFGTGATASAFRLSYTAFLLPPHAVVGDTLSAAALPQYVEAKSDRGRAAVVGLAIFVQGASIGLLIGTLQFLFALEIIGLLAPGASTEVKRAAARMLEIMAFAAPAYVVSNSASYLLTAHNNFSALASRTSLLNVGLLVSGAAAFYLQNELLLAFGVLAVNLLFCIWTCKDLSSYENFFCRHLIWKAFKEIPRIFKAVAFLIFVPFLNQLNVFFERVIASAFSDNTIPALDYARFISETVLALTAIPLSIMALSRVRADNPTELRSSLDKAVVILLYMSIPVALFLYFYAPDVVRVVFKRGAFDEASVLLTSSILAPSALALPTLVVSYYLIKILVVERQAIKILAITLIAVVSNVAFNFIAQANLGPSALGWGNLIYSLVLIIGALYCLPVKPTPRKNIVLALFLIGSLSAGALIVRQLLPIGVQGVYTAAGVFLAVWIIVGILTSDTREFWKLLNLRVQSVLKK